MSAPLRASHHAARVRIGARSILTDAWTMEYAVLVLRMASAHVHQQRN